MLTRPSSLLLHNVIIDSNSAEVPLSNQIYIIPDSATFWAVLKDLFTISSETVAMLKAQNMVNRGKERWDDETHLKELFIIDFERESEEQERRRMKIIKTKPDSMKLLLLQEFPVKFRYTDYYEVSYPLYNQSRTEAFGCIVWTWGNRRTFSAYHCLLKNGAWDGKVLSCGCWLCPPARWSLQLQRFKKANKKKKV